MALLETGPILLFGIETGPMLLIGLLFILLFGATQIPKLARSLGKAKGEFNLARKTMEEEAARVEAGGVDEKAEQVRQTARGLGIATEGKSTEELKRLIQEKLA